MELQPLISAAGVQTLQVILSLVAAFLCFKFLESTAQINQKGIKLGGAAAMFVVTLYILSHQIIDLTKVAHASVPVVVSSESNATEELNILSPEEQMTTSVDISRMDKNSFHVDDELQVSIPNPPNRNWMIERRKDVPIVNEHDLPLIKFGEEMDDFSI